MIRKLSLRAGIVVCMVMEVLGRVSGTRDGAADGLTRHGWVMIDGAYYDPEAQFAGWYRGVYGNGSYDINHTISRYIRYAS